MEKLAEGLLWYIVIPDRRMDDWLGQCSLRSALGLQSSQVFGKDVGGRPPRREPAAGDSGSARHLNLLLQAI